MIGKEAYVHLTVEGRAACDLMISGGLTGAEACAFIRDVLAESGHGVRPTATAALTVVQTGYPLDLGKTLAQQDLRDGDTLDLSGCTLTGAGR